MTGDDAAAWIRLSVVPGLGDQSLRKLLKLFGSPETILAASESSLAQVIGNKLADRIKSHDSDEITNKTLTWLDHPNHAIVTLGDAGYPALLLETEDPPPLLYVVGKVELIQAKAIAVDQ